MRSWFAALLALAAACGSPESGGTEDAGSGTDATGGGDASVDAPTVSWETFIERSWSLMPGEQAWRCKRIQLTEDVYIGGFRSLSPLGTHHDILTVSDTLPAGGQVGEYICGGDAADPNMLYASGIATNDVVFPDGVAIKLKAGQYVNVQVHVYNASDSTLTGTSGIEITRVNPADVVHEAEMLFAGTFSQTWKIPSNGQPYNVYGGCSSPGDWNLMMAWPHMHQLGVHQKVEILDAFQNPLHTLVDAPYSLQEQKVYPLTNAKVLTNQLIQVTCTYVNNVGVDITLGDGEQLEMCLTGLYKWPADGAQTYGDCVEW